MDATNNISSSTISVVSEKSELEPQVNLIDETQILDNLTSEKLKTNEDISNTLKTNLLSSENIQRNLLTASKPSEEETLIASFASKNHNKKTNFGDLVILYESRDSIKFVILEKGKFHANHIGHYKHEDMVNKSFGERIYNVKKDKYFVIVLFMSNLWERCMTRMTQILFTPDISLIISLLNINKNSIIYESGTGSGCLSTNISQVLMGGRGHLYTFEFNKERAEKLNCTFKLLGFEKTITCTNRDVVENGFELNAEALVQESHKNCGGIFIDLPTPWLVLKHVKKVLKSGSPFVSFSPCIEQVDQTMHFLRKEGFVNGKMFEVRYRAMGYSRTLKVQVPKLGVKRKPGEAVPFEEKEINVKMNKGDMRGHTGFLIYATNI
jgi:tRNA (adenine57-N1/adenine58-N1)-methyltransferase